MAAGVLPKPGTEGGPCALGPQGEYPDCGHTDCFATYGMANERCHYCGKRVGYEVRFYRERYYHCRKCRRHFDERPVKHGYIWEGGACPGVVDEVLRTVHALCAEEAAEA